MGKIKDQATNQEEVHEYSLKEEEFNYIVNVNVARNNIVQEYNRVMSSFLHYIACSRMGYKSTDNLKFELDFDDESHKVKVWKIEENFMPSVETTD